MPALGGIYEIANVANGKRYVGSAANFNQRWNEHRSLLRRGAHHSRHLQASWLKHGETVFEFRKILVCADHDLLFYEQRAIDALCPEYNVCKQAGNSLGTTRSPETRAKIAAKALGRKRSLESIEKGAEKLRGRRLPPERVAHLLGNKHAVGLKHTEEWKRANALRNTGKARPKSAEHRAKIAASLKGRKATTESRANQSAAQRGKKRGPYRIRSRP